jgi:hypothetical protein
MQSNLGAGILIWRAGGKGERMTATWRTQDVRNTREGKFDRLDDSHWESTSEDSRKLADNQIQPVVLAL